MKKLALIGAALIALTSFFATFAQSPEAEMRSTWIASVWRIDWPPSTVSSTGNAADIRAQKQAMTRLLDSLAVNNFNAAKLQIRSNCDALYKSSYEPWSDWLVARRGMDPGYDPLQFFVEECHKRNLEAHAWVNPYRYESSLGRYDGTPGAYRDTHPEWLLDIGNASILNPALPEVRQRICDIVREIVTNYDIDGLLFDDYFYIQGVSSEDADNYTAYKNDGGTLSLKDWRRDNVNRMIADVNRTIKEVKPWVRFGVGPAGITCTTPEQASRHDVPVCSSGNDYQYNGIYSDPLAWLEDGSIDYISPQIYWAIGYESADFDIISKWWSDVMPRYGRHLFISKDISSLTASSKAPASRASGEGVDTYDQYRRQIEMTRAYSTDGYPGSVFYSCKFIYKSSPKFGHYLLNSVYRDRALMPPMPWLPAQPQQPVEQITLNGKTLSWTPVDGMRYAIFNVDEANPDSRRVLGFTYSGSFDLKDSDLKTGTLAVAPYDRFGNVYSLLYLGKTLSQLAAPVLKSPAAKSTVEAPFTFEWSEVPDATSYIIEGFADEALTQRIFTRRVFGATQISSHDIAELPFDTEVFWRVHSLADNFKSGVSTSASLQAFRIAVSSPANGDNDVSLTPLITWNCNDRDVTVSVATDRNFTNIVAEQTVHADRWQLPRYILKGGMVYYVRVSYERQGIACESDVVRFRTQTVEPTVPTAVYPVHNGLLHADRSIVISPLEGVHLLRAEICASDRFYARQSYVTSAFDAPDFTDSKLGAQIKIAGKGLVDGNKYYMRLRATFIDADGETVNTEYSSPIQFTYTSKEAGVDDVTADSDSLSFTLDGLTVSVRTTPGATVALYSVDGKAVASAVSDSDGKAVLTTPARGVYMLSSGSKTLKIIVSHD